MRIHKRNKEKTKKPNDIDKQVIKKKKIISNRFLPLFPLVHPQAFPLKWKDHFITMALQGHSPVSYAGYASYLLLTGPAVAVEKTQRSATKAISN